jgi:hypothetical protein
MKPGPITDLKQGELVSGTIWLDDRAPSIPYIVEIIRR